MVTTDFSELVLTLVRPLVKHQAAVRVIPRESERYLNYVLDVDPADVGRVIGRQGHVIAALRTVVEGARDKRKNAKKIRLVINDQRH